MRKIACCIICFYLTGYLFGQGIDIPWETPEPTKPPPETTVYQTETDTWTQTDSPGSEEQAEEAGAAQETVKPEPGEQEPPRKKPVQTSTAPAEYSSGEFLPWLLDTRRAEIIFFGALPVTFFLANECFDIYRYIRESIIEGVPATDNAPWPFESSLKEYSDNETLGIIISAVSAALVVSLADYIIGRRQGRDLSDPG